MPDEHAAVSKHPHCSSRWPEAATANGHTTSELDRRCPIAEVRGARVQRGCAPLPRVGGESWRCPLQLRTIWCAGGARADREMRTRRRVAHRWAGHNGSPGAGAMGDALPHRLIVAGDKGAAQQLDEFILHVLDEVEVCPASPLHDKDCEVRMRLLDAGGEHAHEHRVVLCKIHHQLLLLLDSPEPRLVQRVRIVEEEVVLRRELHAHGARRLLRAEEQDLDLDGFERADLLRRVRHLLHAQLEWHLVLIGHPVACWQNAGGDFFSQWRLHRCDGVPPLSDGSISSIALRSKSRAIASCAIG
eukprot:1279264-Prymnesium_polylepis.1